MRALTASLLAVLLFAACENEPAEPDTSVPTEPEEIVEEAQALHGQWVITEQNGEAPADLYFVTFTQDGEYLVQDEAGNTERSTFRLEGENLIAVTDSAGTRRFTYDVDGATLTLSGPGAESRTVLQRRDNNF